MHVSRLPFSSIVGVLLFAAALPRNAAAQILPDHPILTEVYTDPPGAKDGPVARDPTNAHQEYIELYLPRLTAPSPDFDKDALRLTFYEVEGDSSSSGNALVNYRFDLPTFDLDPSNGTTAGAIARPPSGVVVLGWVDYVGNPPTDLAGTPATRVGLVNGGITSKPSDYVFIAINGHHFTGTTNFDLLVAESLIHLPNEASSGVIQNGSGAYLLVDRDAFGYVERYDDKDTAHVPPLSNADPSLATGTVLRTSALLDGFGPNDDSLFDVLAQPFSSGSGIDLATVLPTGGAFSLLIPQVPEKDTLSPLPGTANGYARLFVDVPKTTESAAPDDPVADATTAYRHIRNDGPFFPTPGRVVLTTSPPELGLARSAAQNVTMIPETTGEVRILAANVGGDFPVDIAAAPGASSDPAVATFAPDGATLAVGGQTYAFPKVLVTTGSSAADGASASATVTVTASNSNGGDPAVLAPIQATDVTATVLNPKRGLDAAGAPFQTTVFVAVQPLPEQPGVPNELSTTDLGAFLAAQPDITTLETLGNGAALIDPATDISAALVVTPMIKELPGDGAECTKWKHPAGPVGRLSFADTVVNSAEMVSGPSSYDKAISTCAVTGDTVIRAIRVNVPDTFTSGGPFSPSETVHFVEPNGNVGAAGSGLTNVTTSRTFEVALIDTAVRLNGTIESGQTDDFGILIEVALTEPAAPVVTGEFIFLSIAGGLQGADIDSLDVPPGNNVASIIYLDLDNLHTELGVISIESLYIIDSDASSTVDIIEGFSLHNPTVVSPPSPGACCLPNGACQDVADPAACDALGGAFEGQATDCANTTCIPFGACCLGDGSCANRQTADQCAAAGGMYQGDATDCGTATCIPFGACCLGDGSCANRQTADQCAAVGGMYQGDATDCGAATCTPFGACCLGDGSCVDDQTAAACGALPGQYQGDGSNCATIPPCEPVAVPTASQWGLVLMALILVVAGARGVRRAVTFRPGVRT